MSAEFPGVIRNCTVRFRRECTLKWEDLRGTENDTVRFCDTCRHEVYLCMTDAEAVHQTKLRHCIAKPMPDATGFPSITLGQGVEEPEPPAPEQQVLIDEYMREYAKTRAIRAVNLAYGSCESCGYPLTSKNGACIVCARQR